MRILVLDVNDSARATVTTRIEEALRQAGVRRAELLEGDPDSLAKLVAEDPPHLCFIGPGCYRDLEASLARYRMVYPKVPVAVVLNNEVYSEEGIELRRALRIRVIPIADIGQMAQFILDCDAPSETASSASTRGVISVLQFKGGVGSSTVACALAACWARNGVSTALVDLDDVNPQISDWACVGSSQRRSISEAIRAGEVGRYKLGEIGYPVASYDGGLTVFAQPEHYGESFHFKADVLENAPSIASYITSLIKGLQEVYDVVIIDAGRSWGISTFAALTLSQKVLTVIDDDAISLRRSLENFNRIYRESDDTAEFDLGKWSFLLNAYTGKILSVSDVLEEIDRLDVFPEKVDLMTLPYSEKGREWGLTPLSFFDLAEQGIRNTIGEIAFGLVPFQYEAEAGPIYDRLKKGLTRMVRA